MWALSTVALGAATFVSAALPKWTKFLEVQTAARVVLGAAIFVGTVWVALKVLLFFYVRRQIRFITIAASFVMWLTGTLTIGSWFTFSVAFYIPEFAAGTISASDATVLSVVSVVAGFATLYMLVRQFPPDSAPAPTGAH